MLFSKCLPVMGLSLGLIQAAHAQAPVAPQPAPVAPPRTETIVNTPIGTVQVRSAPAPQNVPPRNGQIDPNRVDPAQGVAPVQVQPGVNVTTNRLNQQVAPNINAHIVNSLILKNQEEVELTKFIKQDLQNEKVREFAAQLAADHESAVARLRALSAASTTQAVQGQSDATYVAETTVVPVPQTPAERRAERQADRAERLIERSTGTNVEVTPNIPQRQVVGYRGRVMLQPRYAGTTSEGDLFLQIQQDAAQECMDLTVAELMEAKEHKHLDQAFLGMQAGMHMQMLAQLTALEKHTNGELQQFIQEAKEMTQKHHQMAKDLMHQLKNNS